MILRQFIISLVIAGAALVASPLEGQVRKLVLSPVPSSVKLDSLPVATVSFSLKHHKKTLKYGTDYSFDSSFTLLIISNPERYDTVEAAFQTLPDWLLTENFRRKPDAHWISASPESPQTDKLANDGNEVVTDGVLLRGISFGNAQDLVLNSNLNLRMHGKISNEIEIEGAVTDQEYPFQPEGTTTTLQDFDRIYVALHMPHISVLLGDYAYQSSEKARFMKYSKKNRGLQIRGKDSMGKRVLEYEATAALARGRFSRNEINGIEGLQGPYRLTGARAEQFVIVVSGTEVVYLDGNRMERGLQSDYVIDYNSGEITFTPRHIINAFSRIVVEFQYTDRFYSRAISGAHAELAGTKATWFAAVYNEQDMRSQPIQQDLEVFDSTSGLTAREILQKAGDNPTTAILPGIRRLPEFSSSEPNYIRRDTGSVTFYQYTATSDTFSAFYRITFSYTGPGKGTYRLTGTAANGKVYSYVGYISGIPAGDYEPVLPLQAPNRLSMAEAGLNYRAGKNSKISVNVAASQNDRNLFSGIGDSDNSGVAAFINASDRRNLGGKDSANKWYLQTELQAEQTSANFTTIERYRSVEFGREWNRSLYNPQDGLQVSRSSYGTAGMEIGRGKGLALYAKGGLNKSKGLNAQFVRSGMRLKGKHWFANPESEFSLAETNLGTNKFEKLAWTAGWFTKSARLSGNVQREQSLYNNALMEIQPQSYGFRLGDLNFKYNKGKFSGSLFGGSRINQQQHLLEIKDAVRVNNAGAELTSRLKNGFVRFNLTYRTMTLLDTVFKNLYATENHAAGRLEYNFTKLFSMLSGNVYYQSISGREQQRQYSYFEVPAGQGYYTWIDFNNNGIKEVNEFQETQFRDQAQYVRLLIPTGNYIKAQNTEFNGNLLVQPRTQKKNLSWHNRITWNYSGRTISADWLPKLLPFTTAGSDTSLLAYQSFVRNLAELSGNEGLWLLQYSVQNRAGKVLFTNGFDYRKSLSHNGFIRLNPSQRWQIKFSGEIKNSSYTSEFVPANNFKYIGQSVEPFVTFQPGSRFRISGFGKFSRFFNDSQNIAGMIEGGTQWNRALGKAGMLELKASVLQAAYKQTTGTALSYDILQGFSQGRNLRFVADLRFNAGKNVQMLISYEGRKTGDVRFIHIGRVEARYLF